MSLTKTQDAALLRLYLELNKAPIPGPVMKPEVKDFARAMRFLKHIQAPAMLLIDAVRNGDAGEQLDAAESLTTWMRGDHHG